MAKRPPRRGSFQPGAQPTEPQDSQADLAEARRIATQFERAAKNRRDRDSVAEAEEAAAEPVKEEPKTTGRGLPGAAKSAAPAGAAPMAPASPPHDPNKPFASFAPVAEDLTSSVAQSRSDSHQVVAIVFGMMFMVGAATVVLVVGGAAVLYTYSVTVGDGALTGIGDKDDVEHIRDTADPTTEIIKQPRPRPKAPGVPEEVAPEPVVPTIGDATIIVPKDRLFHSIEVKCQAAGIRTRADFRNAKATARGLPLNEDCRVTFQGSLPATTNIRGGQTKTCTFEPTNCR